MASHRGGKYTPKMGGDGTGGVQELGGVGGGWTSVFQRRKGMTEPLLRKGGMEIREGQQISLHVGCVLPLLFS